MQCFVLTKSTPEKNNRPYFQDFLVCLLCAQLKFSLHAFFEPTVEDDGSQGMRAEGNAKIPTGVLMLSALQNRVERVPVQRAFLFFSPLQPCCERDVGKRILRHPAAAQKPLGKSCLGIARAALFTSRRNFSLRNCFTHPLARRATRLA